MLRGRFDLVVFREDVNEVVRFAEGLVMASRCPALSLAAMLLEASEIAILSCKDSWDFKEDKEWCVAHLRIEAQNIALNVYDNKGGENNG